MAVCVYYAAARAKLGANADASARSLLPNAFAFDWLAAGRYEERQPSSTCISLPLMPLSMPSIPIHGDNLISFQSLANFFFNGSFFQKLPLFVGLFASSYANRNLNPISCSIYLQWHHCQACSGDFAHNMPNFFLFEEKLPALGGVGRVSTASKGIGPNMRIQEPQLFVVDAYIASFETDRAIADGFHLGTAQDDPRFVGVENAVVMEGLLVCGEYRHNGMIQY